MGTVYKFDCDECGRRTERSEEQDTFFCPDCGEKRETTNVEEMTEYTVIIEVDGHIEHKGREIMVPGVYGVRAVAKSPEVARGRGLENFKSSPPYNTDISVDGERFPDGRYLDDWGYKVESARAIDAVPSEDYGYFNVRWRDRGFRYCKWE